MADGGDVLGSIKRKPMADCVGYDAVGNPYLESRRCRACGAVFFDRRLACARCGADDLMPAAASQKGKLHAWTIVHRSFPGVPTPFIHAVVDMADGGSLCGTLTGVAAEPALLPADLPVELFFAPAAPSGQPGHHLDCYFFRPATPAAAQGVGA